MSITIPQKKIVERNGKTFLQTFYVKTDNASSAAVARFNGAQPQVSTEREFDISPEAMHALDLFKRELDYNGNVEDFVNGFNRSFENGEEDVDSAEAQYLSDNDPEEVNRRSFSRGFRQGLIARLGKERENYYLRSGRFLTDHKTGLMVDSQRQPVDMTKKVVVHNPFKEGDDIIIPAGTPYRVGWRGDKRMVSKRKKTIKVQQSYKASSDAAVGWVTIMQPTVTASYNEYQITPAIIEANGLEVRPGYGGDFLEGAFRGDRY